MKLLPSPNHVLSEIPLTLAEREFVLKSRKACHASLSGLDARPLLVVGPCSLHDLHGALEYAEKLKVLAEEVKESFQIVMRAYFEKPRTGLGWKGILHDPGMDGTNDIEGGIYLTRNWLKALLNEGIPLAAEFLDIVSPLYFEDLISWGCVGARTVASPFHRQMASGLKMPIGFKNTTDGNIDTAIDAVKVAKAPHRYTSLSPEGGLVSVETSGNPMAHVVLRGGRFGPNYQNSAINETLKRVDSVMVDCSHDNSSKQPKKQIEVFENVMEQVHKGEMRLRGLMVESYLFEGNQSIGSPLQYGVSVTDACLDFESTRNLILQFADQKTPCALYS